MKKIRNALSDRCESICMVVISPYGDGHAAKSIAPKMIEIVMKGDIDLKKFYDVSI